MPRENGLLSFFVLLGNLLTNRIPRTISDPYHVPVRAGAAGRRPRPPAGWQDCGFDRPRSRGVHRLQNPFEREEETFRNSIASLAERISGNDDVVTICTVNRTFIAHCWSRPPQHISALVMSSSGFQATSDPGPGRPSSGNPLKGAPKRLRAVSDEKSPEYLATCLIFRAPVAPPTGFEPVTLRLTVECSAVELRGTATDVLQRSQQH